MARYNVYITKNQISRNNRRTGLNGDNETCAFHQVVSAKSRNEAVAKCINDIWAICDDDIKVISVYAGVKGSVTGSANRMTPVQYRR